MVNSKRKAGASSFCPKSARTLRVLTPLASVHRVALVERGLFFKEIRLTTVRFPRHALITRWRTVQLVAKRDQHHGSAPFHDDQARILGAVLSDENEPRRCLSKSLKAPPGRLCPFHGVMSASLDGLDEGLGEYAAYEFHKPLTTTPR
jgi:hypothetical protein